MGNAMCQARLGVAKQSMVMDCQWLAMTHNAKT